MARKEDGKETNQSSIKGYRTFEQKLTTIHHDVKKGDRYDTDGTKRLH
jgi:hypothetical protein